MPTSLSSYLAASAKSAIISFQLIVTLRGKLYRYCTKFTGFSGNTWETAKIAHESHNDVRHLCRHISAISVLLAELGLWKPPSGNPEGLALLEEGCTFPLPLWSSNHRELGERDERGQGATAPPPIWRVGRFCPPLLWTSPSRRLHFLYFDFKSDPHATPLCVCISRDIHEGQLVACIILSAGFRHKLNHRYRVWLILILYIYG